MSQVLSIDTRWGSTQATQASVANQPEEASLTDIAQSYPDCTGNGECRRADAARLPAR